MQWSVQKARSQKAKCILTCGLGSWGNIDSSTQRVATVSGDIYLKKPSRTSVFFFFLILSKAKKKKKIDKIPASANSSEPLEIENCSLQLNPA